MGNVKLKTHELNAILTNNSVRCIKMKRFTFCITEINAVKVDSSYLIKSSNFH